MLHVDSCPYARLRNKRMYVRIETRVRHRRWNIRHVYLRSAAFAPVERLMAVKPSANARRRGRAARAHDCPM